MSVLRVTLLCDGPYDHELLHPLKWLLYSKQCRIESDKVADLSRVQPKPETLRERADAAVKLYPCNILFVHRDSERISREERVREIESALRGVSYEYVPVVPVRMTEAWFLHSEEAIRTACGNPNGEATLQLPKPADVSDVSDPKKLMDKLLLDANGATGRRYDKLQRRLAHMRRLIPGLINDFAPLMSDDAFVALSSGIDASLSRICVTALTSAHPSP